MQISARGECFLVDENLSQIVVRVDGERYGTGFYIDNDIIYKIVRYYKNGNGNLERDILRSLKSYLYQEINRNPFIFVMINHN